MINNVPTAESLYSSGKECFNLSWTMVYELLQDLEVAEEWNDIEREQKNNFWMAARRKLLAALTIAQQGVELVLKGDIAKVSPYLLISKFEESAKKEGCDFSDFFTINEKNLIKVRNCVSDSSLADSFVTKYEKERKLRNEVMHLETKDYKSASDIEKLAIEILEYILNVCKVFFPSEKWINNRFQYLENSTDHYIYDESDSQLQICYELNSIIKVLSPTSVKTYFGIDPKKKGYYCPNCYFNCDHNNGEMDEVKLARLISKTELYCPACGKSFKVGKGSICCCKDVHVYDDFCVNCSSQDH